MTTQSETARVLADYYAAFSTLDVQAFLPYFHEPCLLIGPDGMFPASTHAVLATAFTTPMEDLRSRGYDRSELNVRHTKALSETAELVTGIAMRYKADGQVLERVGVTYVMHKNNTGWKIAVLILHDPNDDRTPA